MIVDDLDVIGIALLPAKADPPLPIDTNAELPVAIAGQGLQPIARQTPQIVQSPPLSKNLQALLRLLTEAIEPADPLALI
jgi:hypothetical protein